MNESVERRWIEDDRAWNREFREDSKQYNLLAGETLYSPSTLVAHTNAATYDPNLIVAKSRLLD
jgi:hypothetical protein